MKETLFGVLAGIVVLLALASLVGAVLEHRATKPESIATVRNLNARTRSWWVMVLVVGGAILAGHTATVVLFAILSFMALREFWTLTPSRRGDHYALFLSFFVVLPYHYYLLAIEWYGMFIIFIPVYAFLLLPAVATLMGDTNEFLARSAKVQWGLMLTVFAISHAPALLMLDTGVPSALLIVYLIIVVQLSDVFQYVWGKLIGKHRFSPNISPNKTIEGLVGGGLSAILVGTMLHRMTPFSPLQAAAVSTVIVVAGFFGGFVLSAIKRDLKAKDWGYIIEGHGGVLDRVDSLTFAAPLFFHVTRYWFTS
ncbi:phosphatidate cytidylyltransferase [Mesorhizobium sp. YM1C-6-2]|uniref:phosphatidate cytidylyltransferase n=1 Tax=Mesorhizobium sp. YM1C-6-2 TaxID=1827501 RepID=UPI000EF226F5|nr:phosphatidate cytidylyltransferase [Mesorhizobium sp. YM1C-6-2]RLP28318.1 phosphatidate cytidylyltransferase [Mesorhizobium sp. YM1C-6-2]